MPRVSNPYLGGFSRQAKSFSMCASYLLLSFGSQLIHACANRASDDLAQPAILRSLLKDLREVRQAKIRLGLQSEGVMRGSYLQVRLLSS